MRSSLLLKANYGLLAISAWLLPVGLSARTVISQLPYTINSSGHYVVQNNLTFTANADTGQNAITVMASDVVIDLGGFNLVNESNMTIFPVTVGIECQNAARVMIQDGTIQSFDIGVLLGDENSAQNLVVFESNQVGILASGTACVIEKCRTFGGANGIAVIGTGSVEITANSVADANTGISLSTTQGCGIYANYLANCSIGLILDKRSAYSANLFTHCKQDIHADTPATGN